MTQALTKGAAAIVVLAGAGIISTPAQAFVITTGCAATNVSCTLTELDVGGTIQVGDKKFDEWKIGVVTNVTPSNIVISGIDQDTSNPGPGLKYTFLNNELSLTGAGVKQIFFDYRVSVTAPSSAIIGNLLRFTSAITGDNSKAEAHEVVFEDAARTILALGTDADTTTNEKDVVLENDTSGGLITNIPQDSINFFKSYQTLYTTNEFSVDVSDTEGTASITEVKQNFSQVPEPLTILGTGVVLGAMPVLKKEYAKRNKKKDANA